MAAKAENFFERTEKKYMLDVEKKEIFLEEISPYVTNDVYAKYTLCNLYFDTDTDEMIQRSLAKPIYKEKLRMRSYGVPQGKDFVFLEIKKKYKGIVYKRRVMVPLEEAMQYVQEGIFPPTADTQIMKEIDYCVKFYQVRPKLFLAYDRQAFAGKEDSELRLTIDENIRSRRDKLDLSVGDEGEILLPQGECILEIKTSKAMPLWLVNILTKLAIYPCSFSKYGAVYRRERKEQKASFL